MNRYPPRPRGGGFHIRSSSEFMLQLVQDSLNVSIHRVEKAVVESAARPVDLIVIVERNVALLSVSLSLHDASESQQGTKDE